MNINVRPRIPVVTQYIPAYGEYFKMEGYDDVYVRLRNDDRILSTKDTKEDFYAFRLSGEAANMVVRFTLNREQSEILLIKLNPPKSVTFTEA